MKEKKLIPEDLFDLEVIKKDILNEISPYQEVGLFTEHNKDSVYYKAILQNLFFATLNCPINKDQLDKDDTRERGFRRDKNYGDDQGTDYLLRYKKYFKNPDAFLAQLNDVVPFLNGGLFECLDDKIQKKYIDGFTENKKEVKKLVVPDFLFFGLEEEADLSEVMGFADKKTKNAAVKGLLNILKSYKFTITENTPIEEEVALDPELLGKVFENLLASYNPETKTTARKQTGSFYTPREIVNYMVDESLIAYLKNKIQSAKTIHSELSASQTNLFGNKHKGGQNKLMEQHSGSELKDNEERLEELLHNLFSYNPENPFAEFPQTSKIILEQLDKCTILDPACGSGAFPMGVLQKMVHILEKLDPDNRIWKEVQIEKAKKASDEAFDIENKQTREDRLIEINDAFDEDINNPDYARKLFLIENCIYGVDIQPIATQISKLRFFISLVVEQNVDKNKLNFGIRPLPNLETKFVAANTLIGIEKENTLFSTDEIKDLEQKLKKVRNKLFGARTKETKLKYRAQDKELRLQIAGKLKENGFPIASAEKLASWDPFDQNASSSFFDPEWMFDIKEGFDIVIGNPPYVNIANITDIKYRDYLKSNFKVAKNKTDLYAYFLENGKNIISNNGTVTLIVPNSWLGTDSFSLLRKMFIYETKVNFIVKCPTNVFDAAVTTVIISFNKNKVLDNDFKLVELENNIFKEIGTSNYEIIKNKVALGFSFNKEIKINQFNNTLGEVASFSLGIKTSNDKRFIFDEKQNEDCYPLLRGKDINKYYQIFNSKFIWYKPELMMQKKGAGPRNQNVFNVEKKILIKDIAIEIQATIDNSQYYTNDTINIIYALSKYSFEYVTAVLNSKLINKWFKNNFEAGLHIKINQLSHIPLVEINSKLNEKISSIVNSIIHLKKTEEDFQFLENQLDQIIYKLYNLNFEEVKNIDPAFELSENEYEEFKF